MKIERDKGYKVRIKDLRCGETFEFRNDLFIKTRETSVVKDSIAAVHLENGRIAVFSKDCLVHSVQAKVVVEE